MSARRFTVWTLRSVTGVILILLLAGGAGFLWLRGSIAPTEGTARIPSLTAETELLRDADGIVTIRAMTEHDAYRALGYAHAQDRLWQMDFMRRTGAGRLSEVAGDSTLRIDRLMRTLGLYRAAEASLAHLNADTRAALDAYAEGVNAFIDNHEGPWPPEFYILRYRPEPWRPADSLVWGRLMALQLSGNWSDEVRRFRLAKRLSPEQVAFLWPGYPANGPVALADLAGSYDGPLPVDLAEILPWEWAPKDASNAWVLSGANTNSGKPILANDPHLGLNAPGVWYLARIETPDWTIAGGTAPGTPFILVGHNGSAAWGHTTAHSDTQDIFIERVTPGDATRYDTPDGPMAFETRQETILVRGEDPVELTVRTTRHGPVVSDIFAEAAELIDEDQVLALAWPALLPDDRTADAVFAMSHARNWDAFEAAAANWHSPHESILFADTNGTVALIAPARVPLRKAGDGRTPVPGWDGSHDWIGFIPFEEMPRQVDPPRGKIVTANNRLVPDDYPYLISAHWRFRHRAHRIEELLAAGPAPNLDAHQAIQLDILSNGARELTPVLLQNLQGDSYPAARELLADWDFRMDRTRPEPLIFHAWIRALNEKILADELGPDFPDFQSGNVDRLLRVLREGEAWCDDVTTEAVETCPVQVTAAFEAALTQLEDTHGGEPSAWRWGDAHVARFPHPILSRVPFLSDMFSYALAADGDGDTINRGGAVMNGPPARLFEDVHGPGLRALFDLADLDNSRFMIATGQSGNLLSPHYGGLAERWRDGNYVTLDKAPGAQDRFLLTP